MHAYTRSKSLEMEKVKWKLYVQGGFQQMCTLLATFLSGIRGQDPNATQLWRVKTCRFIQTKKPHESKATQGASETELNNLQQDPTQ